MAQSLDFRDVVALLNCSRTVLISPEPDQRRADRWALYKGEYRVHTSTLPFEVLYLSSSATQDNMDEAKATAFHAGVTQVVYAPSLDAQTRSYHREVFQPQANGFWSTREYLRSFLKDELTVYIDRVSQLKPKFYIDPQVETPSMVKKKIPNPLLGHLRDSTSRRSESGSLAVLLGEPGQGKTFMSQHLVAELARSTFVPVYINSQQWRTLAAEHLGSIEKTITNSFGHFSAAIPWIDGHEDQFLRATLRVDLFRIVFDGFDEYILKNDGRLTVNEALDELATLATNTGARLLITSRETFWNANVASDDFTRSRRGMIYRICPFDVEHAKKYFDQRFEGASALRNRATGTYGALASGDEAFVGRGFVLKLVADLVAAGSTAGTASGGAGAMNWLMFAFCEREELRQALPMAASKQLKAFQQFAADVAIGEEPTSLTLQYAIHQAAPELDERTRLECIEKMSSHPLLSRESGGDRWTWNQDQLFFFSLAEWVIERCEQPSSASVLAAFIERLKLQANDVADLAAMIVDLSRFGNDREPEGIVRTILGTRPRLSTAGMAVMNGGFLSALVTRAIDACLPQGSQGERAVMLTRLCDGAPISGLTFTGTFTRLALQGVSFKECHFDRVLWANCSFGSQTVFDDCRFSGGRTEFCTGFGDAVFDRCKFDGAADAFVRDERIKSGRVRYTEDDLRIDFKAAIDKFVSAGGMGLKTVKTTALGRGRIHESRFKREIIGVLEQLVVEEHELSGGASGYHVKKAAEDSMRFYAANGVLTGVLAEAFDRLRGRAKLN